MNKIISVIGINIDANEIDEIFVPVQPGHRMVELTDAVADAYEAMIKARNDNTSKYAVFLANMNFFDALMDVNK